MVKGDLVFVDSDPIIKESWIYCKQCGLVASSIDLIDKDDSFIYKYYFCCNRYYIKNIPMDFALLTTPSKKIVRCLKYDLFKQIVTVRNIREQKQEKYEIEKLSSVKIKKADNLEIDDIVLVKQKALPFDFDEKCNEGKVVRVDQNIKCATVYLFQIKTIWNLSFEKMEKAVCEQ